MAAIAGLFAFFLFQLAVSQISPQECSTIAGSCANVVPLPGLQQCITAASCGDTGTSFCSVCSAIDTSPAPSFNLGNPAVAECLFQFAHYCNVNLDVGTTATVCAPPVGTPTPCADMFVEYDSVDAVVASADFTQCVSVANANCLGFTSHPFCAAGQKANSADPLAFLFQLETTCAFPRRSIRGTYTFSSEVAAGVATLNADLVADLLAVVGNEANLLEAFGAPVVGDTTVTAQVDIFSGVDKKPAEGVRDLIAALLNDPTSDLHKGTVTKYLTGVSYVQLYPELVAQEHSAQFTNAQKAGIVAGVLVVVALFLVVYQIYAYLATRAGEVEEDEDDDSGHVVRRVQIQEVPAEYGSGGHGHSHGAGGHAHSHGGSGSGHAHSHGGAGERDSEDEAVVRWS